MTTLRLIGRQVGPGERILEVHGEFGLVDADRLQQALDELATEADVIVVGLDNCDFIDSIAIAALLRARDRLAEIDTRLAIAEPTGQVRRVLEVSGLDLEGFLFQRADEALTATE
jgi:anti-sigma B factor antagonist